MKLQYISLAQRHIALYGATDTIQLLKDRVGEYHTQRMTDVQIEQAIAVLHEQDERIKARDQERWAERNQRLEIQEHNAKVDAKKEARYQRRLERRKAKAGL